MQRKQRLPSLRLQPRLPPLLQAQLLRCRRAAPLKTRHAAWAAVLRPMATSPGPRKLLLSSGKQVPRPLLSCPACQPHQDRLRPSPHHLPLLPRPSYPLRHPRCHQLPKLQRRSKPPLLPTELRPIPLPLPSQPLLHQGRRGILPLLRCTASSLWPAPSRHAPGTVSGCSRREPGVRKQGGVNAA